MRPPFQPSGSHVLADFYGVDAAFLCDQDRIEQVLKASARAAGAHILSSHFHHFGENQGVTGVLLLAESHISIHTWPQEGFAAFDIFMCGQAEPERALDCLRQALSPLHCHVQTLARGYPEESGQGVAVLPQSLK